MTVKSVVDIDVNDASFKRFSELFGKYQAALSKQPDMWKKTGQETSKATQSFADIAATLLAMNILHKEGQQTVVKTGKELQHQQSLWTKIHRSTTGVVKDVGDIGKWLARMGVNLGLAGIASGIAGLWGLVGIASSVTNQRTKALGLGLPMGYAEAFEKFQGKNISGHGEGMLQAAVWAKFPGTESSLATFLHVNPMAGNAFQLSDTMLLALRNKMKTVSPQMLEKQVGPMLSAWGLSLQDLMTIHNQPKGWFHKRIKESEHFAPLMGLHAKEGAQYQDFLSKVTATLDTVWTSVENRLTGLLGPIQNLVSVFGKDVNLLLNGGVAKAGINMLAHALDEFTAYIGSGRFTNDIKDFSNDVKEFATAVQHVGFAFGAVGNEFTHPVSASQNALDYYNDLSGGWLKYTPPFILDTVMKHFASPKSIPAATNVNVKTSHQVILKNQTGGSVNTSMAQHGSGT